MCESEILWCKNAGTQNKYFQYFLEASVCFSEFCGIISVDTVERQIRSGREHLEQILHNFSHFGQSNDLRLWTCTDELSYFQCMHFYNRIPTVEIWSDCIYDNIVKQIQYFDSTAQMAGSSITQLLKEQLEQLCEHQYEMAKEGHKWVFSKGNKPYVHQGATFDLYHNSMAPVGITLMAESTSLNGVFVVFDDPNFMFVGDEHFFQYTKSWMLTLRKKCIKISQEGEGPRRIYFESLKNRMFS